MPRMLRVRVALPLLAALLWAGSAGADKLVFSGVHGITFTPNWGISGEETAAGTGVATVNGGAGGSPTLSTLQLTEHFTQLTRTIFVDPAAPAHAKIPEIRLGAVRIDPQAQGGIFAPILAAVQGSSALATRTMPGAGQVKLCKLAGCASAHSTVLTQSTFSGARTGVGVGGSFAFGNATTSFLAINDGWTIGTASVTYRTANGGTGTLTGMGFVEGPLGNTGTTLSPTSNPMSGTVQLVTPVQLQIGGIPNFDRAGLIVRLTVHFQPEPGRLLLLGAGATALAALGLQRRRSAC